MPEVDEGNCETTEALCGKQGSLLLTSRFTGSLVRGACEGDTCSQDSQGP